LFGCLVRLIQSPADEIVVNDADMLDEESVSEVFPNKRTHLP
jgi:hypothetical protein